MMPAAGGVGGGTAAWIASLMAEALALPEIAVGDSFIDLGGSSLSAMNLVNRIVADADADAADVAPLRAALLIAIIDNGTPSALAEILDRAGSAPAAPHSRPAAGHPPVSASEERLWLAQTLYPQSAAYNVVNAFEVRGPLDVERLRTAAFELVARHRALRTHYRFDDGCPAKIVAAEPAVDFDVVPVADLDAARRFARQDSRRPFELSADPPCRLRIYRVSDAIAVVLIVVHHIAVDGWSMGIVLRELSLAYAGQPIGGPPPGPPVPPPAVSAEMTAWWEDYLRDAPARLDLDPLAQRPATRQFTGAVVDQVLGAPALAALRRLARARHTSLFAVLLAALAVAVRRRTGRERFAVGTVTASRESLAAEREVGFFANTVPVIAAPGAALTFAELVSEVAAGWRDVLGHASVPFEAIAAAAGAEHDPSRAPLVDVVFILQGDEPPVLALAGCECAALRTHNGTAKFDLTLEAEPAADGLRLRWEYCDQTVSAAAVERLAVALLRGIDRVAADPDVRVADLIAPDPAERRVLARLDRRGRHRVGATSVPGLFRRTVDRYGDRLAVLDGEQRLTFRQVDRLSLAVAGYLREVGAVAPGEPVGLALPRSADWVAAMLAVARLGAVIVPIDPGYPCGVRKAMLSQAGVRVVLDAASLPAARAWRGPAAPAASTGLDDALYMIVTSGSAGRPKCVIGRHRGLLNRCAWAARTLPYQPGERACVRTPVGFVDVFAEVFAPLAAGVPVVIASEAVGADLDQLTRAVHESGATRLLVTPSLLRTMLDSIDDLAWRLARLRVCTISGEALDADLAQRARQALSGTRLINLYGSSEVAGDVTWFDVATLPAGATVVPIGWPIDNAAVWVTGSSLAPVPPGVPGEIVVAGDPVALGYRHDDQPGSGFIRDDGQGLRFRTGDLGLVSDDGALVYLGRADRQLKIRGCRVEPDQVRAVLLAMDGVKDAAVVGTGTGHGQQLEAYVVPAAGGGSGPEDLRRQLMERMPGFMVPAVIEERPALPVSNRGKLDYRALLTGPTGPAAEPAGPVERLVASVWAQVLGLAVVGRDADFFALGGDSLAANRMVTLIGRAIGRPVSVRDFLRAPTVAGLARVLTRPAGRASPGGDTEGEPGALALTAAQQQLWFFEQLAPRATSYHVPLAVWVDGELDHVRLSHALRALVARHDALRQVFGERHGQPVVEISDTPAVAVPVAQATDEAAALAMARAFVVEPFRPDEIRLRAAVFATPGPRLLVLVLHHLSCDGASLWLILDEIAAHYSGGGPGPAGPTFSAVARAEARSAPGRAQPIAALARDLAGYPHVLDILGARAPAEHRRYLGDVVSVHVPAQVVTGTRRLAAQCGVSVAAVTLAAYAVVLEAVTGVSRFLVSVPVANRIGADELRTVGFMVNSVPAPVRLESDDRFVDAVRMAAGGLALAWRHHDVPLNELVKEIGPARMAGRSPLCQVEFAFQVVPGQLPRLGGARLRREAVPNGGAKFELSLDVVSEGEDLSAHFEYDLDCLDRATVTAMAHAFLAVLSAGVARPARALADLPLADPGAGVEPASLASPPARAEPLAARIERQIAAHPNRVAVDPAGAGGEPLTYRELGHRSGELAGRLIERGVRRGDRVAVALPRGTAACVAVVAVIRSGASLVCLPPELPPARRDAMLRVAAPRLIITGSGIDDTGLGDQAWPAAPADEAYVAFTSGSTGTPRAVAVSRHGLDVIVAAWGADYDLERDPGRHLQVAAMSFDVFIGDLCRAFAFGGTLVTINDGDMLDPRVLVDRLGRADTVELVPAVARLVSDYARQAGLRLTSLRRLIVGSDRWDVADCRDVIAVCPPETRLICSYGTTEATIDSTRYDVDSRTLPASGSVPIGSPLPGVTVSVRDSRGRVLPCGLVGELWIGGPAVGIGYLNGALDPGDRGGYLSGPGGRWYRTGDLVRAGDGVLVHCGRRDNQVKVRGVRVELAEVEHVLRAHPAVLDAAVVPIGEMRTGLVAFVVLASRADPAALRAHARRFLPDAAIPSRWRPVDALPRSASGKLDRGALAALDLAQADREESSGPPGTALAATVAAIWSSVLGTETVGPDTDFFAAGGHSLQAARLAWRLGEALGSRVTVDEVLTCPTPLAFADSYAARSRPATHPRAAAPGPAPACWTFAARPARQPPRSVLITGATGFIGRELLACLLESGVETRALIRAAGEDEARARVAAALTGGGHDPRLARSQRLSVAAGRLDEQGLGLTPAQYLAAARCDAVLNAAAWVNFVLPYDWLAPANVTGVRSLIDLAGTSVRSQVHHLSTRSASDGGGQVDGGYNQTKAAAERLLASASAAGLATAVYRPGFVAAPIKRDGSWPAHHLVRNFIAECMSLGTAPELGGDLDLVPVDVLAARVVRRVLDGARGIDEIGSREPMPWARIWRDLAGAGIVGDVIEPAAWLRLVRQRATAARGECYFEPFIGLAELAGLDELLSDHASGSRGRGGGPPVAVLWPAYRDRLLGELAPGLSGRPA